jgi:hypothetical protein
VRNGRDPARRRSARPYRDSALLYGAFALIVIIVAVLTGGRVLWAIVAAGGAFLLGTAWAWRGIRGREQRRR